MLKKKRIVTTLLIFSALSSVIGGSIINKPSKVKVEAAATETKRVWFMPYYVTMWTSDGALVNVNYFGGGNGSAWPGKTMKIDTENTFKIDGVDKPLYYYDIPIYIEKIIFPRVNPSDPSTAWNESVEITLSATPANTNKHRYELWNDKDGNKYKFGRVDFTPKTTAVVLEFKSKTDDLFERCSEEEVQAILDDFDELSTFEQNQYLALDVGEGVTGEERLNYLRAYAGIAAASPNESKSTSNIESYVLPTVLIGTLGISLLGGYYFINKKKFSKS